MADLKKITEWVDKRTPELMGQVFGARVGLNPSMGVDWL